MHELLLAARNGNAQEVIKWLDKGVNIEIQTGDSGTPLFCAAAEGHINIVKLLLTKGADVFRDNDYGWTPIHVAVQKNHLDILDLLLDAIPPEKNKYLRESYTQSWCRDERHKKYSHRYPWAWPDEDYDTHYSAFDLAVKAGNLHALQRLIRKYPAGIQEKLIYRPTTLIPYRQPWEIALLHNQLHIIEYLVTYHGKEIIFQQSRKHKLFINVLLEKYLSATSNEEKIIYHFLIKLVLAKENQLAALIGLGIWESSLAQLNHQVEFENYLIRQVQANLNLIAFRHNQHYLFVAVEVSAKLFKRLIKKRDTYLIQDHNKVHLLEHAARDINLIQHLLLEIKPIQINPQYESEIKVIADTALERKFPSITNWNELNHQYTMSFKAAKLTFRLLVNARKLNLFPEHFVLPADIKILIITQFEVDNLLSANQLQRIVNYANRKPFLNYSTGKSQSRTDYLKHIGSNERYGFFNNGKFIPPLKIENISVDASENIRSFQLI